MEHKPSDVVLVRLEIYKRDKDGCYLLHRKGFKFPAQLIKVDENEIVENESQRKEE